MQRCFQHIDQKMARIPEELVIIPVKTQKPFLSWEGEKPV
jgi:hypothetical protein